MTKEETKEEILAMKPGRGLDVLIAHEIFDIDVEWDYPLFDINKQLPKLPFKKGEPRTCLGHLAHAAQNTIDFYSTDISAAWRVFEKMREMEDGEGDHLLCCLSIYSDHDYCWEISWSYSQLGLYNDGHKKHRSGCFDDLPEAICKAALLAKLETEPEKKGVLDKKKEGNDDRKTETSVD